MQWKVAAQVYGSTTAKLRAMTKEEWEAYNLKWYSKAVAGVHTDMTNHSKWIGFRDALIDEGDRRAGGTADTDPWLGEVLKYLYEEKEVPCP